MQIKFCELLSTSFLNSLQSAWDSTDPEHKRYGNKFFYNIKCYLRVTCSTNEQEVHQPKLGFTYIKTYCEKLSSINLKWEENLQYKKHEIGVKSWHGNCSLFWICGKPSHALHGSQKLYMTNIYFSCIFSRYNFSLFISTDISGLSTTLFNAWYIFKS